jgi:myo-inositol-1(or 4)-monophosphatase
MTHAGVPYDRATVDRILAAMTAAARAAEAIISSGAARRAELTWQTKGKADYLTEIDISSEAAIRRELTVALNDDFPNLRVLGEEGWSDEPIPHDLAFVVDPLDGTTNFLHGIPAFSVSIAAIHETEPILGLVLDIPHGELFTAVRGGGAHMNGAPIGVSSISDPSRALIGTGFPFGENADTERYARQFIPVAQATSGLRRAGSAAIDLAWLAAGRFDAFWELSLHPWDIAAGILLVREAGGIITGIDGAEAGIGTSPVVAGNPEMHGWLLDVLHNADNGATS